MKKRCKKCMGCGVKCTKQKKVVRKVRKFVPFCLVSDKKLFESYIEYLEYSVWC